MKKYIRVHVGLLLIILAMSVQAARVESVSMVSGQTELLQNITVDRVSIGNPNVIDIQVLSETNEILIQALSVGVSDLKLWNDGVVKTIIVDVTDAVSVKSFAQIKSSLKGIEGVAVRQLGDKVLIEGSIYNNVDLNKVTEIAKAFNNVVVLASKTNIDMKNIVTLDVKFVEVRKNILHKIGVNWDDVANGFIFGTFRDIVTNPNYSLGGQITPSVRPGNNLSFNYLGVATRVDSVINMLSTNGYARLLAQPKLTCISGGQCDFLAGGEVPIPITDQNGRVQVSFKQYGIVLNIQPVADSIGNISAAIEVEVSSIDPSVTVLGVPGFLTRRTVSQTNVHNGETIILSGMVSNESSKDVDKVPLLGHIPIIGELFKSRQFRNNKTELVVFVTPKILNAQSDDNTKMLERVKQIEIDHKKNYEFNLLD